jgi:hypothetical protein
MISLPGRMRKRFFSGVLLATFFAIFFLARANQLTFTLPNEDDATFFLPAWNFAVHGDFRLLVLNAPDGIYWVPHAFYLWNALFFRLFGPTMETARTLSQVTTALAAAILVAASARISRSRWIATLCALILVSPATIYTANAVRMESLIFLLYALTILLHIRGRYLPAISLLAFSLLVHPALSISLSLYLAGLVALRWAMPGTQLFSANDSKATRIVEITILLLVVAAIAAEAVLVLQHLELFHKHMAYQAQRKAGRSLFTIITDRRGLFLCAETLCVAIAGYSLRRRSAKLFGIALRDTGCVAFIALGLQAYAAIGFEGPYIVYSYAIVPATLVACAVGALSTLHAGQADLREERPKLVA